MAVTENPFNVALIAGENTIAVTVTKAAAVVEPTDMTITAMAFDVNGNKLLGPNDIIAKLSDGTLTVTNAQIDTTEWVLATLKVIAVYADGEGWFTPTSADRDTWTLAGVTAEDNITIGVVLGENADDPYGTPVFPAARMARAGVEGTRTWNSVMAIPADVEIGRAHV